ncbi:hypothetical protein NFI96_027963, partial [Prochilodus magdalenae]
IGNVLVLLILGLYENLKSLSNLCLLNLAVSDLIFTLGLPFWACYYIWSLTFGDYLCKAVNFVFSVGFNSSVVFLMLMSVQRYVAVVHPQSDWNRQQSLIGNVLVLLIFGLYENLKSLTNIFLLNLAVSDLIFTLGLPFLVCYYIWGWTFGDFMCKAVNFIFSVGFVENSTEEECGNGTVDCDDYDDEICHKESVAKVGSIVVPIFFTVVVLLSLVGNVLVLLILGLYENLRSLTNIFLFNLAVSDLIFTLGLPFWACYYIWSWTFGNFMCKTVNFVFSVGFYSSTVFLIMMTIQSYAAVVHPQSVWKRLQRFALPIAWVFSFAAALPASLYSEVMADPADPNKHHCEYNSMKTTVGVTYQQNAFFIIAFLVMGFCSIRFLQGIIRLRTNNRDRAIRLISCVVLVFFVSWAPYNIVMFLQTLTFHQIEPFTDCDVTNRLEYVFYVCRLLAYFHCCVNPVLYVFVGVKFKNHLRTFLRKVFICCISIDSHEMQMEEIHSGSLCVSDVEIPMFYITYTYILYYRSPYSVLQIPIVLVLSPCDTLSSSGERDGLVGNVLVLLILGLYKNFKSLSNLFLPNLAVSDLIFTLGLPFWACYYIWSWTFGDFMCKAVKLVFSVGFNSSVGFLMLMTIQRYVAVVHPQSVWNRWHSKCNVLVCLTHNACAVSSVLVYSNACTVKTSTEGDYDYTFVYNENDEDNMCAWETVTKVGSTVVPIFFTVVVLLSLIGNVLVLLILGLYENLKSLTNIFILNLTVSDLIFTLGLPFWVCYYIWGWTFGDFMCKAVKFVFSVGFNSSVGFLMLMTIQRYVAVVHPQSVWNRWHRSVWPIVAWVLSFVAALPELLYSKVMADLKDPNKHYCEYDSIT